MRQGIVICTWSGGRQWATLALKSLGHLYDKYPIYVVVNDAPNAPRDWIEYLQTRYSVLEIDGDHRELGAIKVITEYTDLDEFWLFQDTIEILNPRFIINSFQYEYNDWGFSYHKNPMQYYMGKWKTKILDKIDIPLPTSKLDSIEWEWRFYNFYRDLDNKKGLYVVDHKFNHNNKEANYIDNLFGEERLAVVGTFLIKRLSLAPSDNLTSLILGRDAPIGSLLTPEQIQEWKDSFKGTRAPVA